MVLKNKTRGQLNQDLRSPLAVCLFILHFFPSLPWEFVLKYTHGHTQRPILVGSKKEGSQVPVPMWKRTWAYMYVQIHTHIWTRHLHHIIHKQKNICMHSFYCPPPKKKRISRSWTNRLGCETKRLSPSLACSNSLSFFLFSLRESLWSGFAIVKLICGLGEKKATKPL